MQYYILYNIVSTHTIRYIILFVNTYFSVFYFFSYTAHIPFTLQKTPGFLRTPRNVYCTSKQFSDKIYIM